jgi:DNA-binding CsgD family transcriptional regulator
MAAFVVPPYPIRASGAAVPAFVGRVAETSAAEEAWAAVRAGGSSNREIASRLRITENTAANHVRSILTKTGTANRTQAAMMAASRGWLDALT